MGFAFVKFHSIKPTIIYYHVNKKRIYHLSYTLFVKVEIERENERENNEGEEDVPQSSRQYNITTKMTTTNKSIQILAKTIVEFPQQHK